MFSNGRVVGCNCERLYDVIFDVARYPEFVPGWLEVRVLHQDATTMVVDQRLGSGLFSAQLRSVAKFERPSFIRVRPLDDRATGLNLEWSFAPHDSTGCNVSLRIFGQSSHSLLASSLDAAVMHTGQRLIDIFVERSRALPGEPCDADHLRG